ncbi:MAG: ParB N-terminal domain-containing protein, partial [Victivallaceae bacterium]|nr:ParB N-terminal domain-containing protein [Victivallaceae bacterium]
MTEYTFHEAARQFPLLPEDRLTELAKDIRINGQHEPIRAIGQEIVDGRNRYLACSKAGVEPYVEQISEIINPYVYVWSMNGERRDLTQDQRYLIWKKCSEKSGEWEAIRRRVREQGNASRGESLSGRATSCGTT